jgi:hypothetical protein
LDTPEQNPDPFKFRFFRFLMKMESRTKPLRIFLYLIQLISASWMISCAPQREFVRFEDAGTFRPGRGDDGARPGRPEGEYDSYELIDHGAPNHGIAPMYHGHQPPVYGGGYPALVETYDPYGNPQGLVIPNPW